VRQLRRAQKEKAPGRGAVDMLKTRTLLQSAAIGYAGWQL
jgi:hypothetical protein